MYNVDEVAGVRDGQTHITYRYALLAYPVRIERKWKRELWRSKKRGA